MAREGFHWLQCARCQRLFAAYLEEGYVYLGPFLCVVCDRDKWEQERLELIPAHSE